MLNDNYFLQDIELISDAEPDIAAHLFNAAKNIDSLREKYYNNYSEIMNLIANAKSDAIAEILCKLTR